MNYYKPAVPKIVSLALGAREGDPEAQLSRGIHALASAGVRPLAVSSLWETQPVGIPGSDPVLNAALRAASGLGPRDLLQVCRAAEEAAGRRRTPPEWRSLDVDILLCEDLVLATADLEIPHPRFHARRFNLEPLAEIAPDALHPVLGMTISDLLARCTDLSWARVRSPGWGARFIERDRGIR